MRMVIFVVNVARIFAAVIYRWVWLFVFALENVSQMRSTVDASPVTAPARRNQYPSFLCHERYNLMRLPDWYRAETTNPNALYVARRKEPMQDMNGQVEYTGEMRGKAPVLGSWGRET